MSITKSTITTYSYDGFALKFEPAGEDYIKVKKTKTGYIVRYLVHDGDPLNPFESEDGNGRFFHWKDHGADERREYERLRGICPDCGANTERGDKHGDGCDGTALNGREDAVAIDKYEHGAIFYSVSGEGQQCRWDTSSVWCYWLPDKEVIASWPLTDEYKRALYSLPPAALPPIRRKYMVSAARRACELFNWWCNGEVYGVVEQHYTLRKRPAGDHESVWGCYGLKSASEELAFAIGEAS